MSRSSAFSHQKFEATNRNWTQKSFMSNINDNKQFGDLSGFLRNDSNNVNKIISFQGNRQNTLKRYQDNTIDDYFKCKKKHFDDTKNRKPKIISRSSTSSGEGDTIYCPAVRTAENNKINKSGSNNERKLNNSNNIFQNSKTDRNDNLLAFFNSQEENSEFVTSPFYDENNIGLKHYTNHNKNIELPPINAKHGINYQKLLEDDLDFFQSLTESKDDKFINLLCSINRGCEQIDSTHVRNELPLDLFLQNFNSNHQNQQVLCQKCGSEVDSNNTQKEYKFKYVREIKKNNKESIETVTSNRKHEGTASQDNFWTDLDTNIIKQQFEHSSSISQTLGASNKIQANMEDDFICLKSLAYAENNTGFLNHSSSSSNTTNLTQMKRTQSFQLLENNISKTQNEINLFRKRHSLLSTQSSLFPTQETLNSSIIDLNDKIETTDLEIATQPELNKYEPKEKTSSTIVQDSLTTLNTIVEANPNKSMLYGTPFLTKLDSASHINIELKQQQTEKDLGTNKINLLQNVVLDNALVNHCDNISAPNKPIQTVQNRVLGDINLNTLNRDTPTTEDAILSSSNMKKVQILTKKPMKNVSFDNRARCKSHNENNYQNDINNLREFLKEKIRDIGQYLLENQNQENSSDVGNNLTNLILNNLNHPDDDVLLKNLESQDIFSQPVTFVPSLVNRANLKCSQISNENKKETLLPTDEMLVRAIDGFTKDDTLISKGNYDVSIPENVKKLFILRKISDIFMKLLNDIENEFIPSLCVVDQTKWNNCTFDEHKMILKPIDTPQKKYTSLKSGNSRSKFKLTIFLMGKIVALLINNSTCTKRELYYQIKLKNFVKFQNEINTVIDLISCIIDEPPWDFGILATQKGLVYGDLKIILSENEIINCNIPGGSLVPQDQRNITRLESYASFILIVEKDSVFQKLLDEDLPNRLPRSFIMITAKGYLDISTRLFVKKLWQILKVPVFALVDADPCGIEIMLTYRFGSLGLCHLSRYLALPSLRWIGIHPSEIISLNIAREPLTNRDQNKILSLLSRPYIHFVPKIKEELELMLKKDFKAQIEGVMKSENYLRNFYIPSKLCAQDFI